MPTLFLKEINVMTSELNVIRKPCDLYPTCPFKMEGVGRLGGGGDIDPDLKRCSNCEDVPLSTPDTDPGSWRKIE